MDALKMKLYRLLIVSLISVFASGCAISPGCEWVKPIRPSKNDTLTRGTKQQVLTHNETWEKTR